VKKKSTLAVIAVLAVLAIGVAVLAVLNGRQAMGKAASIYDTAFLVLAGDAEYQVTLAEIEDLGPRDIEANYKKSGREPETRTYRGAPFAEVLAMKGIDPAGFSSAVFSAADGYASALPMEKALDRENCFIVIDPGDEGPFRMILAKDEFSQQWCKLLTDVRLR